MFFGKKVFKLLKVSAALDEFRQFQLGAIRTQLYHTKRTQEKTLKKEVKLTHVKKFSLKNRKFVQTPISDSTLKVI